ncbi:MAG: ADP-ribosylglycohydrolase family protein, partial [Planctomycetaceae bacterium]|nr:ADP-ribosylglycohydrolase family protein [Planctomycetaceae bacterium]
TQLKLPAQSHFEGALLGCAVGDALGAPFEGLWEWDIPDDLLDRRGGRVRSEAPAWERVKR